MANWFKIYETDLDETRLKYALSKLPEVGWVWIGILSECCKHRSDTIRWSKKEHDLFGFSDRLKVSIPKVNEAINLLVEIEYIEHSEDSIKVLKWCEKQSEYCARKDRGDYDSQPKSPRVSDNNGESHVEEKRGEEIRREGEKSTPRIFASQRIASEKEIQRINARIAELKDSDFEPMVSERRELKKRRQELLTANGWAA